MAKEKVVEQNNEEIETMSLERAVPSKEKLTSMGYNAEERFLEVELNGAGVIVGLEAYSSLKDQPNYTKMMKRTFPEMECHSGTFSSSDRKNFTASGSTVIPSYKQGLYAVCFKKSVLESLKNADKFNELANPNLVETIPIRSISGRTISLVREPLDSSFTELIIIENDGFIPVAQLSNYDSNESQDQISVDTQTSGEYKVTIGGLKTADIDGITGLYDPLIPTVAVLETAYNLQATLRVKKGPIKKKFATYTVGTYKVTEFTTIGEVSGNGKLEYRAKLSLQCGQLEKKTYI